VAHQSMIRIPGFSTCSWKFWVVRVTVGIGVSSLAVYRSDALHPFALRCPP
jgi:hypothetical protein